MNQTAEITKIVIKIHDKEATLSLEEARELHKILDELFGDKDKTYVYPVYPNTWWIRPYITWTTTASGSTNGNTLYINSTNT